MILVRVAVWMALALAIVVVERRLGHPSSVQSPVNKLTDQLMSLATMATLAAGLAGSLVLGLGAIQPGWASLALGIALGSLGIGLRAVSMRTLGRFYTLTPGIEPGQTLITAGPYRWVRHPGYLAILLSLAGLQLVLGTWVALASMVFVVATLPVRIAVEERILEQHFSAQYTDYRRRTPYRLVPGIV